MKDGIIELDSDRAKPFGFTSDKFYGYLWKKGNYIVISFIASLYPRSGDFANLCKTIESKGFGIKVPTPFPRMKDILIKQKYRKTKEWFSAAKDYCEIWIKELASLNS